MTIITLGTAGLRRDLLIKQGCTFAIPFVATDNGKSTGTRVDLTGAIVRGQIRKTPTSSTLTASFTGTITNAAQGEFVLHLTALQTAALPAGDFPTDPASKFWWDGEIEFPSGEVHPIGFGAVTIHAEVTR